MRRSVPRVCFGEKIRGQPSEILTACFVGSSSYCPGELIRVDAPSLEGTLAAELTRRGLLVVLERVERVRRTDVRAFAEH